MPKQQAYLITNQVLIVVTDPLTIDAMAKEVGFSNGAWALSFPPKRFIFVPWSNERDKHGNPLPNFELLGHEVWHLQELGSDFHR